MGAALFVRVYETTSAIICANAISVVVTAQTIHPHPTIRPPMTSCALMQSHNGTDCNAFAFSIRFSAAHAVCS